MILKCTCVHAYQDQRYGAGMRAHTPLKNGNQRCTVCSKVKTPAGDETTKK